MTRFIEEHRGRFQVEFLCRTLGATPSTYYAARTRPASARAIADAQMTEEVCRVFKANYSVYGVCKVFNQFRREGFEIAKELVWRLTTEAGLRGARRGKAKFTTTGDPSAHAHPI